MAAGESGVCGLHGAGNPGHRTGRRGESKETAQPMGVKRGLRWAAWAAALIAFSPSFIAGELQFAVAPVFGGWVNSHAESGGMGIFENVFVHDETKKELFCNVPSPEIVWESTGVIGRQT